MKKKIALIIILLTVSLTVNSVNIFAQGNSKGFSDSLITLCKKFYNEGLFKEAVEVYQEMNFDKLSAEELYYLGLSYGNLRATVIAAQYFTKAVELEPDHNGYRLQHARLLSQLGKTNDAISNYNVIVQNDSNNATALYELGLIEFDRKEYGNAIRMFGKLVKLNGNDFLSSYYLGYAMLMSQDPNAAELATKHLEHSVAINPEYIPAISLLASNKFSLQKYYDANFLYGMARKLRPENADFHFKSGLCYERLKLFSDAANLYTHAVHLDSNDANYFDHLGFVHFNMGKYDSAVADYTKAAALDDNPTYFVNLGFAYAKMDSVKRSVESFHNALKLMQLDKIGYIYNQIAAVHYSKQNLKESKAAYEKTLIYNPGNIDAQFYIAMINEKLKDWRNASLAYKKVIELVADDSSQLERINYSKKRIKELKRR